MMEHKDEEGYKYEVFISYRRYGEWPKWIKKHFSPIFQHWLGEELGQNCKMYIDYQEVKEGDYWPYNLSYALSHSKVLVPLWSRQYFISPWCQAELAHMLTREQKCNLRTRDKPGGLIIPAIIHDGQDIPTVIDDRQGTRHYISGIEPAKLQDYTNIRMAPDSPTAEKLSHTIRKWVPSIASAIKSAPQFNPEWANLAADEFLDLFKSHVGEPKQGNLPSLE